MKILPIVCLEYLCRKVYFVSEKYFIKKKTVKTLYIMDMKAKNVTSSLPIRIKVIIPLDFVVLGLIELIL